MTQFYGRTNRTYRKKEDTGSYYQSFFMDKALAAEDKEVRIDRKTSKAERKIRTVARIADAIENLLGEIIDANTLSPDVIQPIIIRHGRFLEKANQATKVGVTNLLGKYLDRLELKRTEPGMGASVLKAYIRKWIMEDTKDVL